jgi:hypothetical protein
MRLLKSQLREFSEGNLAEFLIEYLEKKLEDTYEQRADLLIVGEAAKTQEQRMELLGEEKVLQDMIDILNMEDDVLDLYFRENLIDDEEGEEDTWKTLAESTPAETES